MSLILFKSDNLAQSVIAAALGISGFKCVGFLSTPIDYDEIDKKYEGIEHYHTFGDAPDAPKKYIKIDNINNFIRDTLIPVRIKQFLLTRFDLVYTAWIGMVEEREYAGLSAYEAFTKLFFDKDFDILVLSKFMETARIKDSMIEQLAKSLTPSILGDYHYFRASDYIHRRLVSELKESRKCAIYIDNTGVSENIVMKLFVYGDDLPEEFKDFEWHEYSDPFINEYKCRLTDIPLDQWAKIMSKSKVETK